MRRFIDLRFALRSLARRPTFAAVAIASVALGVGTTTAVFTVARDVLIQPLPFQEPEELVLLQGMLPSVSGPMTPSSFLAWEGDLSTLQGVTAVGSRAGANLTGGGEPARVEVAEVATSFFSVLGVPGIRGRGFAPEEREAGRTAVAVLADGLWRSRYGGDPDVIGSEILLNGRPVTVVGIAPPGFDYPRATSIWLPVAFGEDRIPTGSRFMSLVGRLADDVSLDAAREELAAFSDRVFAGTWLEERPPVMVPLKESMVGDARPALITLLGAVAFVILIACANLANLFLARTGERGRELAVRTALGARRRSLAAHVLTEAGVVAAIGGGLGVLLAVWGLDAVLALAPGALPRIDEVALDPGAVAFALLVTTAAALLFGALPALRATRVDVHERLKQGGRGVGAGRSGRATSRALVVAEVALTIVLLIGSGLLIRSLVGLRSVDAGFDLDRVLTVSVALPEAGYPDGPSRSAFLSEALEGIRALPAVEAAGAIDFLPLGSGLGFGVLIEIEGRERQPGLADAPTRLTTGPDYFESMGIDVLEGRAFRASDDPASPAVAVINRAMAERFWPDGGALGARIRSPGAGPDGEPAPWREVVGIVNDVRTFALVEAPRPEMYLPYTQVPGQVSRITIRTAGDPTAVVADVRARIRNVDPNLPVYDVRTMEGWFGRHLSKSRFNAVMLAVFAGLALILALVGIYGVVSNHVVQRTHEIGVRIAMGAGHRDVLGMVVGEGLALAAVGTAVGVVGALAVTRYLQSLLFGVDAADPLTFTAVAGLLLLTAAAAAAVPARRAARVQPVEVLSTE